MTKHITVEDDPLTVRLFPSIDTNYRYELFWDEVTGHWEVMPF